MHVAAERSVINPRLLVVSWVALIVSMDIGAVARETDEGSGGPEKKLEEILQRHVRLVWAEQAKAGVSDPDALSRGQRLLVLDSMDGKGVRKISAVDGNFSRPLLSPTGERVIYSRRDVENGISDIHTTRFGGGLHAYLAPGYAVDALKLEGSPETWIYAFDSPLVLDDGTWVGGRLVRFAIDQPSKVNVLYEGEAMLVDSVVLSPTGASLLAVRPESGIGHLDIESGRWSEPEVDGAGEFVFDAPGGLSPPLADLGMAVSQGVEARDVRVSEDSSVVVFSAASRPGVDGSEEIYVAQLQAGGKAVKGLVAIPGTPGHADQAPDIWLGESLLRRAAGADSLRWPVVAEQGSLFWENNSENALRTMEFEILGKGRYGRGFVMSPRGGAIVPRSDIGLQIEEIVDVAGRFSMEFVVRGSANPGGQVLFYSAGFALVEKSGRLYSMVKDWGTGRWTVGDHGVCDAASRPRSVVYLRDGDSEWWFVDGEGASVERDRWRSPLLVDPRGLTTFFSGWMELSRIGFHPRLLTGKEIREIARSARGRMEGWRLAAYREVEATLLEASEVPRRSSLGITRRLLVDHRYRVETVGRGDSGISAGDEIAVFHWAILGGKTVAGVPRQPGRRFFLALEPVEDHPEILLEKRIEGSVDGAIPVFLAVERRLGLPSLVRPPRRIEEERPGKRGNVAAAGPSQPAPASSGQQPAVAEPLAAVLPPEELYPRLVPTEPAPPPVTDEPLVPTMTGPMSPAEVKAALRDAAELMRRWAGTEAPVSPENPGGSGVDGPGEGVFDLGKRRAEFDEAARLRDEKMRLWQKELQGE